MPHSLDAGKGKLRALVKAAQEKLPRLPLVHSTDSYTFEEVLTDEQVTPQNCDVFTGEALTYFFYGRPAYRPNLDAEPTALKHYFPVCLLFKPTWTAVVKRIFPFDSGAFHGDVYEGYLHRRMKLGDFSLVADPTTPGKVISLFFGSNAEYLMGRPFPAPKLDPSEFEAQSYLALIHAQDSNIIDSRSSGIEIQTAEVVSIINAVAAVIIPSTFADGQTGKRLKALGIDILTYPSFERTRPSEHTSKITDLCFDYYVRLGLVNAGDLR